jgi:methyltransferase (TIGR00027 family)
MLGKTLSSITEKSDTCKDKKVEDKKTEAKVPAPGVGHTGLLTNYWKNEARMPEFWQQHANGNIGRNKPLFKDEYMRLFITAETAKLADAMLPPKMRFAIAVRHKYFSKALSVSIKTGPEQARVRQVVILGSGYDTRPVRKAKYKVAFFEIDQKEVLDRKKQIYQQHKVDPNAIYIDINYLKINFMGSLRQAGLNTELPTHFIWEGNTMYIKKDDVDWVISRITESFSGRVLISFDYFSEALVKQVTSIQAASKMVDDYKNLRAPMINGYDDIKTAIADKFGLIVIADRTSASYTKEYKVDDVPFSTQEHYYFCTLEKLETPKKSPIRAKL